MTSPPSDAADLIQHYYQAFNLGDRPAMLRLLAPDVIHEINQGPSESGLLLFARFLDHMDQCYEETVEDLVVLSEPVGLHAAAEFFIRGRYLATDQGLPPASGQIYRLRVGAFFNVEGGLIGRITVYYNLPDWLRQVGAVP